MKLDKMHLVVEVTYVNLSPLKMLKKKCQSVLKWLAVTESTTDLTHNRVVNVQIEQILNYRVYGLWNRY